MFDVNYVRTQSKRPRRDADMRIIISDPPAIAAAFACAVTVHAKADRLVARNGELSIFSAYRRIFPQARFEMKPYCIIFIFVNI